MQQETETKPARAERHIQGGKSGGSRAHGKEDMIYLPFVTTLNWYPDSATVESIETVNEFVSGSTTDVVMTTSGLDCAEVNWDRLIRASAVSPSAIAPLAEAAALDDDHILNSPKPWGRLGSEPGLGEDQFVIPRILLSYWSW